MFAYSRPTDSLLILKAPLCGALTGLVGMQLVNLGSSYFFGYNGFNQVLHTLDIYGGLVLFSALTAYDTHVAINSYKNQDSDHLGIAVNFYLDFINILIRMLEVVSKLKSQEKI